MKVDGMDAPSSSIVRMTKSQDSKPAGNNTKDNSDDINTKMLSQITPLDMMEMPVPEKIVINAIEKANRAISGGMRKFEFSIHQKTKQIMVKVIDSDTNEVIREIPPEKTLDMVAKLWEMAGIMVDERR